MNTSHIPGLLCAALLVLGPAPGFLQANPDTQGPPQAGFEKPHKKQHGPPGEGANLTPDEAQRLRAAREKAKNDPTIKSLREARDAIDAQLENAMNAAIVAADASLAPVVEKIKAARGRAKDARDKFESMTPEQMEALKAARQTAKDDPAVVAAREKMKSAQDPEAKREAAREFHEAMKASITKQNPSLAPLLDKIGPPRGGPGEGMGGPPPAQGMEDM